MFITYGLYGDVLQKSLPPPLLVAHATSRIFQATSKCSLVVRSTRDAHWAPEPRMHHGLSPEALAHWARKRLQAGPQRHSGWAPEALAYWADRLEQVLSGPSPRAPLGLSLRVPLGPSSQALLGPACERLRAQLMTRLGPRTQARSGLWSPALKRLWSLVHKHFRASASGAQRAIQRLCIALSS